MELTFFYEKTLIFLIKKNQKELLQDMKAHASYFESIKKHRSVDKGHGRLEQSFYELYDVNGEYFESRWGNTNFRSLIVVNREHINLK